jgi:hypothetical protein
MKWTIRTTAQLNAVAAYLNQLSIVPERPYEIEVKRKIKRRSLNQNSLYWVWITCISSETGNDKDDLHEYFASRYLPRRTVSVFGKEQERRFSTAELDTEQFAEYMRCVERDANAQGIILVSPESPLFDEFVDTYKGKIS